MAEIVISLAIQKIGIALAKGAVDQASVQFAKYGTQLLELKSSMGRVASELRVIHDVLCQMDIRNRNNQVYEGWLEEVQKIAHVMEDMVDEYVYLVGQEHDIGCCFFLKKGIKKPRSLLSFNRIACMVKETEKDLTHLSEIKNRWVTLINNGGTNSSNFIVKRSQDLANISRSLDEEDLVGVDENIEKLEQWLEGGDLERSVIALLGMGGLGKTALAANVYKKEREKFECHAWVSISQTYSVEHVLRNIIKGVMKDNDTDNDTDNVSDNSSILCLEETLKEFLQQRKYLIILDDVWTPEAFDELSRMLTDNGKGSRLIITTRTSTVAAHASPGHTIELGLLPADKAWDLFCKKAFPRDTNHNCPTELKPLSEEIASKCKGLPLAIVSVGSLLCVREKTVEEWRRVNNQLSWEINNNWRLDHVRNVLHLSFIYLPTQLKCCLLYCSLFSEDYIFRRKQIVRLWTAEGFVKERGRNTLEEVAEGYLKELIDRNMLQLVETNSFGRMKKFKMHDILRELALDLCQKNYFGVTYDGECEESLQDVRRLVLHKPKKENDQPISSIQQLRTVITLGNSMSLSTIPLLCTESRYMTVLELSGLPMEKIPDAIGDLFNLRHLGLRDSKVKMLPKSVEKLSNLLTLDLCRCDIHEFPRGIVKLKKLRHLFAQRVNSNAGEFKGDGGICIPNGIENLTNLQTLQAIEAQDESIRQLGELRQLRSLRLVSVKGIYCADISASLVKMRYLSNLYVCANDENEVLVLNVLLPSLQKLCLRGRLAEGALDKSPLFQADEGQNLYELYLHWSELREDPLPSLSRLSNLSRLQFCRAYNGDQLSFLTGWFPKLKVLSLIDLPRLNRLEIQQGAMMSLEKLILVNLSSMKEVPSGIEFLLPLQHLFFHKITSDFFASLRQWSPTLIQHYRYSLRNREILPVLGRMQIRRNELTRLGFLFFFKMHYCAISYRCFYPSSV